MYITYTKVYFLHVTWKILFLLTNLYIIKKKKSFFLLFNGDDLIDGVPEENNSKVAKAELFQFS
jgi:hypothetical protein